LYRSTVTVVIAVFLTVIFIWVFGMGIGELAGVYRTSHTESGNVLGVIAVIYGLGGLGWTLLRVAQMGIRTQAKGVRVRNWVHTTWLAWQDIRVFVFADELESPSGREMLSASLVPYVVLKDGRHIRLSGLTAGRFRARRSREKVQRMLDSLNLEVASHRGR